MIIIIDYKMGNLGSIVNMIKRNGSQAIISSDPVVISRAEKLILPGVGAFDAGMKNLESLGLVSVLRKRVLDERTPLLGICLGMQLLSNQSEEGLLQGLGWLDAKTISFKAENSKFNLKIPHMGWNQISLCQRHPLFADIQSDNRFYFVHSYHVVCTHPENVLATTNYGIDFTSAIVRNNIMGVQFHPEKSHKYGVQLIKNFIENI